MLKSVESVEICSPCDEDPLPTNVKNKAIHVSKAAKPLNLLENGETMMAAMAPIQTRTVRLYSGSKNGIAPPVEAGPTRLTIRLNMPVSGSDTI